MAFGLFLNFYHVDYLDMTWGRFRTLLKAIPGVQDFFAPKSALQLQLMEKEEALRKWKAEHPEE